MSLLCFPATGKSLSTATTDPRMVWAGGDLRVHLFTTPCHGQGHVLLDQVAPRPFQPGLEHF